MSEKSSYSSKFIFQTLKLFHHLWLHVHSRSPILSPLLTQTIPGAWIMRMGRIWPCILVPTWLKKAQMLLSSGTFQH